METIAQVERELIFLGLLDKAREIYFELGSKSALSYIKSSYHLLSKVYHPDLNPGHEEKAKRLQQRLNRASELISKTSDMDLIRVLVKGVPGKDQKTKKKILVVEDEFGIQETLRDVFIMEGYDVRIAVDGEDGYLAFIEFNPGLIFTDIVMPKMSGIELIRKIRQINPEIKVVYMSGFLNLKNLKRDLNEEVLTYGYPCLSKPFKISTILEIVDKYFNQQPEVNLYA
jgi:CheY-like chemotaxis protein